MLKVGCTSKFFYDIEHCFGTLSCPDSLARGPFLSFSQQLRSPFVCVAHASVFPFKKSQRTKELEKQQPGRQLQEWPTKF